MTNPMKLTRVKVSKEEILKAVPGLSWRDLYYSPDFIELDAEVIEEKTPVIDYLNLDE